jgi:hypothetical protein
VKIAVWGGAGCPPFEPIRDGIRRAASPAVQIMIPAFGIARQRELPGLESNLERRP